MIWTIVVVLLVLWILGMFTANTFGGLIYILLVAAVAVMLYQLIWRGRAST